MDDWNSVTKIGKNVRATGTSQRETTIKGKAALNAAARSGAALTTDLKFSSANAAGGAEGQRLTKIDRSDGPVATKKTPDEVAKALSYVRATFLKNQKGGTMTQAELAASASVSRNVVVDLERAGSVWPAMADVLKVQKAANCRLTGANIGQPMRGKREMPPKEIDTDIAPAKNAKDSATTAKTPASADAKTPASADAKTPNGV